MNSSLCLQKTNLFPLGFFFLFGVPPPWFGPFSIFCATPVCLSFLEEVSFCSQKSIDIRLTLIFLRNTPPRHSASGPSRLSQSGFRLAMRHNQSTLFYPWYKRLTLYLQGSELGLRNLSQASWEWEETSGSDGEWAPHTLLRSQEIRGCLYLQNSSTQPNPSVPEVCAPCSEPSHVLSLPP